MFQKKGFLWIVTNFKEGTGVEEKDIPTRSIGSWVQSVWLVEKHKSMKRLSFNNSFNIISF